MHFNARLYDEQNSMRVSAGKKLIELAGVAKHESVLDIGCGTGTLTVELARRAARVVGIDPSDEMLMEANDKTAAFREVSLRRQGAEDMDFNAEFDIVYSSNALQWVHDQSRAVANIFNALVPGGRFLAQLPSRFFSGTLLSCINRSLRELNLDRAGHGPASPWYLPFKDEYESLLTRMGFEALDVKYEEYDMTFESATEAIAWSRAAVLVPYMEDMDKAEGDLFLNALERNFEQSRTERGIVFEFRRVVAIGRKARAAA